MLLLERDDQGGGEDNLVCSDLGDRCTYDETGGRSKTGDWRRFGKDDVHCDLFDDGNGNGWSKWWAY